MNKGIIFWILMILWLICGIAGGLHIYGSYRGDTLGFALGGSLLEFVLFGLLGWQVFGSAVK